MTALGLQKDPFSPEPDSLFYYSFDSFEQRLKVLQELVRGTDLLVLVIGEPSSGKTTLLNRYLASTDAEWKSARIRTDPETASTQPSEIRQHGGHPAYILQDSADPIVIVDDAHQLLHRELEFLLHEAPVSGSSNKIKRLVLFGESNLYTAVTKLAASLSAQPAVNKIYLPGLTEAQTAEYLQHRLVIGGYSGKIPFDSSAIISIHQTSGGYPGLINEIAHQWLNDKYSNKKEKQNMLQKSSENSRRMVAWFAAGIIIILLVAYWLLPDRNPSTRKPPDQKLTKTVVRKIIVPVRKSAALAVPKIVAAVKTPDKPPAAIKTQQTPETKTTPDPPAPIKTVPPEKKEPVASGPIITAAQKTDSQPKTELQPAVKPMQKTDSQPKTKPQPTVKPTQKTDSQPKTKPQPAAKPTQKTDSRPKTEPQPAIKPPPKTAAREIRREKWLLSQDAAYYTIQIIGVSTEKSLLDYIRKNQLLKQNEIAYYESTFNGKPWYQVLYGIYPTKQEAQLAADKLPENIRLAVPWIRRLTGVQNTIGK
jgi:DamX protein